jgi:hypothetical protein
LPLRGFCTGTLLTLLVTARATATDPAKQLLAESGHD